jgi:hypothetical protein
VGEDQQLLGAQQQVLVALEAVEQVVELLEPQELPTRAAVVVVARILLVAQAVQE